jgi:uncharacterized protein with GYD domain
MARFVLLGTFTDQGISKVQDTVKRAQNAKALAKKAGAEMVEVHWLLGRFDLMAIVEAPDDETMTAVALSLGKLGNVKTQTLRAFTAEEMDKIIGKMV